MLYLLTRNGFLNKKNRVILCTIDSREIFRLRETANPSEGFTEEKLWASNTTQGDHEFIRRNEKTKTDIDNFLVVI